MASYLSIFMHSIGDKCLFWLGGQPFLLAVTYFEIHFGLNQTISVHFDPHFHKSRSALKLDDTWHVGGVTIVGVSFCDLKGVRKRPQRYDTKPNQCH